jgi:CO/xanthine dehydrogenase Mo-binding subunit
MRANTDNYRAFRAPGYVEGTFALESAMDALAQPRWTSIRWTCA